MDNVARFGVSIEKDLLKKLSAYMKKKGYKNRSEAIRDMIRDKLVEEEWSGGKGAAFGTVSLVYSHESRELANRLVKAQHRKLGHIVASLHVHIDHHNCMEVLVLKGKAREIQQLGDMLLSTRGVKHGKMTFTTAAAIKD